MYFCKSHWYESCKLIPCCLSTQRPCLWWPLYVPPKPQTGWCYCLYWERQTLALSQMMLLKKRPNSNSKGAQLLMKFVNRSFIIVQYLLHGHCWLIKTLTYTNVFFPHCCNTSGKHCFSWEITSNQFQQKIEYIEGINTFMIYRDAVVFTDQ